MKAGIIVAMEKEKVMLEHTLDKNVPLVLSGIGKVNAALATYEMISRYNPDCIISVGVSGSMREEIRQGDIIVGDRVAYHDVWCGEGTTMGQVHGMDRYFYPARNITEALGEKLDCHKGLLVCGDQFYISQQEDRRILNLHPEALAADMESGAIAQTCTKLGVPFAVVRVVSDTHDDDKSQEVSYADFWTSHQIAFDKITAALVQIIKG